MGKSLKMLEVKSPKLTRDKRIEVHLKYPILYNSISYNKWDDHVRKFINDKSEFNAKVINQLFSKYISFIFFTEKEMVDALYHVEKISKAAIAHTSVLLNKTHISRIKEEKENRDKMRNISLISKYPDGRIINYVYFNDKEIIKEPIIIINVFNSRRKRIVPLSFLTDYLMNYPNDKIQLTYYNLKKAYIIRNQLRVKSLAPFWSSRRGNLYRNSDYLFNERNVHQSPVSNNSDEYSIVFDDLTEMYRITDPTGEYLKEKFQTQAEAEKFKIKLTYIDGRSVVRA